MSFQRKIYQMPQGCSCSYQVSAFGQGGESPRADLQNPDDCLTFTPDEKVTVTFVDVKASKTQYAHVHLWANYHNRSTDKKANLTGKTQDLKGILFRSDTGTQPGNQPITLGIAKGEQLQLGFYLGGLCKSKDEFIPAPQGGWAGVNKTYTVKSSDGSCVVNVHVKGSAKQKTCQPASFPAG